MFRLKELREENGIKRSELARDLNINAGTIANYENEIRQAPYEYLLLFADYFDVSVDYLLGKEERKLINDYRKCSETAKKRIAEYIDLWLDFKPD